MQGKVIVDVKTALEPTNLCLEIHGKEKIVRSVSGNDSLDDDSRAKNSTTISGDLEYVKHSFLFITLDLHRTDRPIEPNRYVIPFSVPLPLSLPASRSNCTLAGLEESVNSSPDNQLSAMLSSFSVQYNLKLSCDPPIKFPNKRSFLVSPPLSRPIPFLLQPKPWNVEGLRIVDGGYPRIFNGLIYMAIRAKETTALCGGGISLSLACRNASTCPVAGIRVTLEEEYHVIDTRTRQLTDSTALAGAERLQKLVLFDMNPVPLQLDGVRLGCRSHHDVVTKQADNNEELIVEEMFRSLHSPLNDVVISIPVTAQVSYTGVHIEILHFVTVSLISDAGGKDLPTLRFPVQVVGATATKQIGGAAFPHKSGSIASTMQQRGWQTRDPLIETASVRLRLAVPSPGSRTFSRNCMDPTDQYCDGTENTNTRSRPTNQAAPFLRTFLEELGNSMDGYDLVKEKLKILDYAILLGSMTPSEFGSVVRHARSEFSKPRIGALLAQNYGGDFTCAHVVAAIQSTSDTFRVIMVEGLLGFCSDLAEQNELVRCRLTDFEQVVVARHSLGIGEPTNPSHPNAESPNGKDEASAIDSCADLHAIENKKCDRPRKEDVCIGVEHHPGTLQFTRAIRKLVSRNADEELSHRIIRQIKEQFSFCRFMLRPLKDSPEYWREASAKELSEFITWSYDRTVAKCRQELTTFPQEVTWEQPAPNRLEERLKTTSDSDSAVELTPHSYDSAGRKERDDEPARKDVCFGSTAEWPGNRALIRAIRRVVGDGDAAEWGPQVYKKINRLLVGRRFFVQSGTNQWKEPSMEERLEVLEQYVEQQRLAIIEQKGHDEPLLSSKTSAAQPSGEPSREMSDQTAYRACESPSKTHEMKSPVCVAQNASPFLRKRLRQLPDRLRTALDSSNVESIKSSTTAKTFEKHPTMFQDSLLQSPDGPTKSNSNSKFLDAMKSPRSSADVVRSFEGSPLHSPTTMKPYVERPNLNDKKKYSMRPHVDGSPVQAILPQNSAGLDETPPTIYRQLNSVRSPKGDGLPFGRAEEPEIGANLSPSRTKSPRIRIVSITQPLEGNEGGVVSIRSSPFGKDRRLPMNR